MIKKNIYLLLFCSEEIDIVITLLLTGLKLFVCFKIGSVNEVLVKPECLELIEECRDSSGLSEEVLSTAIPLEQALNQVGYKF